jgi:hypothetical protein
MITLGRNEMLRSFNESLACIRKNFEVAKAIS